MTFSNNDAIKNSMLFSLRNKERIGENAELNLGNTPNETVGATAVDTSNWDMTRVNAVADTEGEYVPVPKGFVASGATGEHTVKTGFVIYEGDEPVDDSNAWDESCTRNQFVWVPVPDTTRVFEEIGTTGKKKAKLWKYSVTGRSAIYNGDEDDRKEPGVFYSSSQTDKKQYFTRYGMQGYTEEKLYQELSTSFDQECESIKKYGGFYIGRYETGNITSDQPVVRRMNTTLSGRGLTWYNMYPKIKNISSNKNVDTSMIWGCLWDETLQWFIDTEAKTQAEVGSDSSSWGNYRNSTFTYTNTSGGTSTKEGSTKITTGYDKWGIKIPTGSAERNKANNIYDMAGNVVDWTLEGDVFSSRCCRGGDHDSYSNFGYRYPAGSRVYYTPYSQYSDFGFRVHLCVK